MSPAPQFPLAGSGAFFLSATLSLRGKHSTKDFHDITTFPSTLVGRADGRGYKVLDANGQALAYIYARDTKAQAEVAKMLTFDEAHRIAANVAKLPELLGRTEACMPSARDSVRSTSESGHPQRRSRCLLSAISGRQGASDPP